jgi:FkbM family methyltransferase
MWLKQRLRSLLGAAGLDVVPKGRFRQLSEFEREATSLLRLPTADLERLARAAGCSKSQIGQDLFVLHHLAFKRAGYFVEFGATNGIDLSNTHLLEKEYGWVGILAEPASCWHRDLRANRTCHIETACVWRDSVSTLTFREVKTGELSTIENFVANDGHRAERRNGRTYPVKTISLVDLLDRYGAPQTVDYLSIDTEGSEFAILRNFDFAKYRFRVITCEHNFRPERERIYELLTANGYVRRSTGLSRWDDWYVDGAGATSA